MLAEAMRQTLSSSEESLRKIGERAGIAYSTIHGFQSGKRDLLSTSLSKILDSLSYKDSKKFMEILAQKKGLESPSN